jgi:hypothetical protein
MLASIRRVSALIWRAIFSRPSRRRDPWPAAWVGLYRQAVPPATTAGLTIQLRTVGSRAGHPAGATRYPVISASWKTVTAVIPADPQGYHRQGSDYRTRSYQRDRYQDVASDHVTISPLTWGYVIVTSRRSVWPR